MIFFIVSILLILFTTAYLIIISMITYGWFKLKTYYPYDNKPKTKISVIIPARNEENNIQNCLNDIIKQDYPNELYEIIVIDDNSEDNTFNIVKSVIKKTGKDGPSIILIKNIFKELSGKKQAIRNGLLRSSGEIIVTTDADCRFKSSWIRIIADYFDNNDTILLSGPVTFLPSKKIFKTLQSLEFLSLIASAAGLIKTGKPILGNASNMAFFKEAYLEAEKSRTDYIHASGDDIFLIYQIKKIYGASKIGFLKNYEAAVNTEAITSLKEFFSQRIRWVSKASIYKDRFAILVSWITFLFNLSLIFGLITAIFYTVFFQIIMIFFFIKLLIDFPVMLGICHFSKKMRLLWSFIPLEIINVFYVPIIAFAGIFLTTEWKERKIY